MTVLNHELTNAELSFVQKNQASLYFKRINMKYSILLLSPVLRLHRFGNNWVTLLNSQQGLVPGTERGER